MAIVGIVLCGGASRRMGRPKAWLDFFGEPLLCRVTRIVSQVVSPVIVVAGPNQTLPDLPNGVIVAHDPVEFQGPLVGLAAGLALAPHYATHAFVSACDMPFLTAELISLFVSRGQPNRMVVPVVRKQRQPLPALYPTTIAAMIPNLLKLGKVSLRSLGEMIEVDELAEAELRSIDPDLIAFRSMNEPSDYDAAIAHSNAGKIERLPPTSPTLG